MKEVIDIETREAHRFAIQLADGSVVVGEVQGVDGPLPRRGGFGRIAVAIVHAEEGFPTGLFEPVPGHARVYAAGRTLDVDLRGAEVLS